MATPTIAQKAPMHQVKDAINVTHTGRIAASSVKGVKCSRERQQGQAEEWRQNLLANNLARRVEGRLPNQSSQLLLRSSRLVPPSSPSLRVAPPAFIKDDPESCGGESRC